jgi:hypothetical protein
VLEGRLGLVPAALPVVARPVQPVEAKEKVDAPTLEAVSATGSAAAIELTPVSEAPMDEQPQQVEAPVTSGSSFSWSQVGGYLLSERTLHAVLGLGAL